MKNHLIKNQFKFIILLLLSTFSKIGNAQVNIIQNGNFETSANYPVNAGFLDFPINNNSLTNWTISSNSISYHHLNHLTMGSPVGGGSYHIDLNQTGAVTQQNIPLVANHSYQLVFSRRIHADMNLPQSTAIAQINIGTGVPANNLISSTQISLNSTHNTWQQVTISFTANVTANYNLSFIGINSNYAFGGVCIDLASLVDITPSCPDICHWNLNGNSINSYGSAVHNRLGTINNHAVRFITNNLERGTMTHSGLFGFGTMNPTWNFRTTIDNRDLNSPNPNTRNGLQVWAMQPICSWGNGIRVETNSLGGTKALAIAGSSTDRASIWGNGMSWFKNRMQLGGISPTDQICDDNTSGHMLIVNGTGLVNGVNLLSDRRFKQNIKSIKNVNEIISRLNPVTYDFDTKKFPERNFETKNSYGFIAQELKEVLPNIVNVERDEYLSVNYIALIPVLTQAIKEQQSQIEELKNTISKLQNQPTSTQEVDLNSTTLGVALSQNVPNPFTTDTRITYAIPYTFKVAKLGVYDLNGQELKLVALTATTGAVVIQGGNLKPGMYIYTLIVDGKTVASKKMTLTSN